MSGRDGDGADPAADLPCLLHERTQEHCAVKLTVSTEIALPRERVVQLLADPAHLPKWLRGLVLHEPLTGCTGRSVPSRAS